MIEGVIRATKTIICSHSRARIERLIASDQTPLLIGSLVNKCKIACPRQYNLAEEFMHKLHFPDSASLRKDLSFTDKSCYQCKVTDTRHGRKNQAYKKTTGTLDSLSLFQFALRVFPRFTYLFLLFPFSRRLNHCWKDKEERG